MGRVKSQTLYSRNGIRIVKTYDIQPNGYDYRLKYSNSSRTEILESIPMQSISNKKDGYVKKESKLGFYYNSWVRESDNKRKAKSITYELATN